MSRKRFTTLVAAAVLVGGVVGCSSEDSNESSEPESTSQASGPSPSEGVRPSGEPAEVEPAVITINDFKFEGPESVAPGATVKVVNKDRSSHTVTSEPETFEEVVVEGGAEGTFTAPKEPGEYSYVCDFHPEMTGTLVVK